MRASKQGHIVFEDCFVPEENVVGSEGGGFYVLADFFNHGRVIVGGHGLGLSPPRPPSRRPRNSSTGATPSAAPSTSSRRSNTPSRTCESASSRLARSTGAPASEVADNDNAGYWAALAKTKSTEVATDCAEKGMKLHGGRSILTDRRIARVYRDVRIPVIYEGANDIQRNLIYRQSR